MSEKKISQNVQKKNILFQNIKLKAVDIQLPFRKIEKTQQEYGEKNIFFHAIVAVLCIVYIKLYIKIQF